MGELLSAYDNRRMVSKIDVVRILVKTKHTTILFEDVNVHINGLPYNVKLVEDSQGQLKIQIQKSYDLDDSATDELVYFPNV